MKPTILALYISGAAAYPWVAEQPGVDSSLLKERRLHARQQTASGPGGPNSCPYNPNHVPAAPITTAFPYNGAKNGIPGNATGGYMVPHPDDPDHQYQAPTEHDIRGPCPGLNAMANHNFLARDGIVTYTELVDAQQNVYNVGWDLASFIAAVGLTVTDGDLSTERLSIGCDATNRTSAAPAATGSEPGLDGHNHFEADASLTRSDYFLAGGDDFSFNATLWAAMVTATGGVFDFAGMAAYRYQRYWESRNANPNFYFGPLTLLLYGASSFVYEAFPSGQRGYAPDLETIALFFGAQQVPGSSVAADGAAAWTHVPERIPANWTNRVAAYGLVDVGAQIFKQYRAYPVAFGGNAGRGQFEPLSFAAIQNGSIGPEQGAADFTCLLYQAATQPVQSGLNVVLTPSVDALNFLARKIAPAFQNLGCPLPEN